MFTFKESFRLLTGRVTRTDLAIERVKLWASGHGRNITVDIETQLRRELKDGKFTIDRRGFIHPVFK